MNPSFEELSDSRLDMVVAGTKDAVLMVESEADELTEEQMLGAVVFAHQEFQVAIYAIGDFGQKFGKTLDQAPSMMKHYFHNSMNSISHASSRRIRFLKR